MSEVVNWSRRELLSAGLVATGGLILGVLETFGVALTGPSYRSIMIYAVFIAVLLLRPQGLLGAGRGRT